VIQAICFDAFGTLVEITDKRLPFRALLRGGVRSITAGDVLTKSLNLQEVAASVSHELGEGGLTELERDLQAECGSVRLRHGARVSSPRLSNSRRLQHGSSLPSQHLDNGQGTEAAL
jgi:hypothetical protein